MTGTVFQQENATALVFYQFFSPAQLFLLFVSLSRCYFCICGAGARSELYRIFSRGCTNTDAARRITCYCLPLACQTCFARKAFFQKEEPLNTLRFIHVEKDIFCHVIPPRGATIMALKRSNHRMIEVLAFGFIAKGCRYGTSHSVGAICKMFDETLCAIQRKPRQPLSVLNE